MKLSVQITYDLSSFMDTIHAGRRKEGHALVARIRAALEASERRRGDAEHDAAVFCGENERLKKEALPSPEPPAPLPEEVEELATELYRIHMGPDCDSEEEFQELVAHDGCFDHYRDIARRVLADREAAFQGYSEMLEHMEGVAGSYLRKIDQLDEKIASLEAERRRDALDGQAGLDEANNRILELQADVDAMAQNGIVAVNAMKDDLYALEKERSSLQAERAAMIERVEKAGERATHRIDYARFEESSVQRSIAKDIISAIVAAAKGEK